MSSEYAKKFAGLSPEVERFAVSAADNMNLSARGFYRMLKVSRTIADMRKSESVEIVDISEALRYRTMN
jgi:magnesium chelatase family protein